MDDWWNSHTGATPAMTTRSNSSATSFVAGAARELLPATPHCVQPIPLPSYRTHGVHTHTCPGSPSLCGRGSETVTDKDTQTQTHRHAEREEFPVGEFSALRSLRRCAWRHTTQLATATGLGHCASILVSRLTALACLSRVVSPRLYPQSGSFAQRFKQKSDFLVAHTPLARRLCVA